MRKDACCYAVSVSPLSIWRLCLSRIVCMARAEQLCKARRKCSKWGAGKRDNPDRRIAARVARLPSDRALIKKSPRFFLLKRRDRILSAPGLHTTAREPYGPVAHSLSDERCRRHPSHHQHDSPYYILSYSVYMLSCRYHGRLRRQFTCFTSRSRQKLKLL